MDLTSFAQTITQPVSAATPIIKTKFVPTKDQTDDKAAPVTKQESVKT